MQKIKKICLADIDEKWFSENNLAKESKFYLLFKKITDLFFGCAGFILFIVFFPFIATAIKIDSKGSIIYKQIRAGKDGKKFVLYKFRTMREHQDQHKKAWREKDKDSVTRVGKFLRRTHFDELPQAINLLSGDLSFVGPRAEWIELAKIFEKEIKFYKYRYLVKPGIIGWAQINFPPSKSIAEAGEKFEYDLFYIKNRSAKLDLEIILKLFKLFAW